MSDKKLIKSLRLEDVLGLKGRVRILEYLAKNLEMNISEIVKKTKINHNLVINHLNYLVYLDFIEEKNFGRIRIFRYKLENPKARALKNLIDIWSLN